MPELLLKTQNLSFSFGEQKILNNLSLELQQGEIVTLLGWSGSGKTTLFKILTGIFTPEQGSIVFSKDPKNSISYMSQEDLLLPWRTVLGNLLLVTELGDSGLSHPFFINEAQKLLSEMGLEHCTDLYPDQLSGGMRQRVSLARALLQKRPLLFLDEPFGSLDVVLREQIYALLRNIKDEFDCTIMMVTHDFHDAICLSDRILFMHHGSIQKAWEIDNAVREDSGKVITDIRHELFQFKKGLSAIAPNLLPHHHEHKV